MSYIPNVNSYFSECKRQNLRGMLGNAINLTKEMEELLKDKAIGIDTGNGNPTPVTNTGVDRTRPKMFCITPGRVLTKTYLCGQYFPDICSITIAKCFSVLPGRVLTKTYLCGQYFPDICSITIAKCFSVLRSMRQPTFILQLNNMILFVSFQPT